VAIVLTVLSFLLNNYKVGLKMTLIDHMHLISITASHEGGSQRPLIRAQVAPIHKKNSVLEKGNYRPVSVLPAISKIHN
jgi:hypothetical protein